MSAYGQGGYQPQEPQDDLNTDDNTPDPITEELTDDPTEGFGVPVDEFKQRLDEEVSDEDENLDSNNTDIEDDEREDVESKTVNSDDPGRY